MKTPPFLLGSGLVFWGWQTGFLIPGVIMALVLEAPRVVSARWEISDEDFARIWMFCLVAVIGSAVYAFSANEGPSDLRGFLRVGSSFLAQRSPGLAATRTTSSLFRWLPMIFFCFAAAQAYSTREGVPFHAISMILRYRRKKARKLGLRPPATRTFNVSYPFFGLCLFSSSLHSADDTTFFWGFCLLMTWALWPQRSPRFALILWAGVLAAVVALSYFGQRGIGQFQSYLGSLNTQWLSAFTHRRLDPIQSQTEIGNLGRVKTSPQIIIRLEAPGGVPPRRLREAAYRAFKNRTWYAGLTENEFSRVAETNETTFPLLDKPVPETAKISCYLAGGKALLPLPEGVGRLEHLLAYNVWKSPLGSVLEEGPGLVVFDALYGPGETMDVPPGENGEDLSVHEREAPALDQVVDELHLQGQDLDRALKTLARFFSTQFTYSMWHDEKSLQRSETPLTRFLLHSRSGHCEYFATAAVLLLRSVGLPARYAVGYAVIEGSGQSYVVRQRDAHAWCLVWDKQRRIWRDFDPTPATWVAVDTLHVSWYQKLSDLWARVSFEISKFRWGQSQVRQYLLWTLLPVLSLLLYQIVFRKRRRLIGKEQLADPFGFLPGLDSEFYELEKKLAARGLNRQVSEPLSGWFQRIAQEETISELRTPLSEILRLHYRYRFDPHGLNTEDRERLRSKAKACSALLDQTQAVVTTE
jgi:hypothetical protein